MSEYDLVCDACAKQLKMADGAVSWRVADDAEREFTLTHLACVPSAATDRVELGRLAWPNGFLQFVTERFGRRVVDPAPLRAIVWALAPFVVRHDNAAEMDALRAASFGQRLGVKPGASPLAAAAQEVEGGK